MEVEGRRGKVEGKDFGERNLKLQKGSLPPEERTQQHRVLSVCAKNSTGH